MINSIDNLLKKFLIEIICEEFVGNICGKCFTDNINELMIKNLLEYWSSRICLNSY